MLAALEVDLASIVASIPVFWPLLTESWGAIFVTQEVHVTRHHRRLSGEGDGQFELNSTHCARSGSESDHCHSRGRSRSGSDGDVSLKLVIMDTDGVSRSRSFKSSRGVSLDLNDSPTPPPPPPPKNAVTVATTERLPPSQQQQQQSHTGGYYDRNDPYVRGRVYPLEGGMVASEAQVVSEGQRGFERNYREHHFGGMTPSLEKLDEVRASTEQRTSRDEHGGGRSWSLSMSRKSSRGFQG